MNPRNEAPPEGPALSFFEARTAARLARARAACELPIARTFGTLEGRVGEAVHAVAIEPGGRFGAVAYRGGVQRWDLDALECVDAWTVPYAGRVAQLVCLGPTPADLRAVDERGHLFRGRTKVGEGFTPWNELDDAAPHPCPGFAVRDRGAHRELVRLADGATAVTTARNGRLWCDARASFLVELPQHDGGVPVCEVTSAHELPYMVARVALAHPSPTFRHAALAVGRRHVALSAYDRVYVGPWDTWAEARCFDLLLEEAPRVAFTADERWLVCVGRHVARIDLDTLAQEHTALDPLDMESVTATDPVSGRVLVVSGGRVQVADPGAAVARTRASGHAGAVVDAQGTRDGAWLVTLASDGSLLVRDRRTGELRSRIELPPEGSPRFTLSPDGREVLTVDGCDGLQRWRAATGERVAQLALPLEVRERGPVDISGPGSLGAVLPSLDAPKAVACSADGRSLAVATMDVNDFNGPCVRVDLARDVATRLPEPERPVSIGSQEACQVAFDEATGALRRLLVNGTSRAPPRIEVATWEHPTARLAGCNWRGHQMDGDQVFLSRTAAHLWWVRSGGEEADEEAWQEEKEPLRHIGRSTIDDAEALFGVDAVVRGWLQEGIAGDAIFAGVFGSERDRVAVAHLDGSCVVAHIAPGGRLVGIAPDDGALWVDDGGLLHEIALPATTAPSEST